MLNVDQLVNSWQSCYGTRLPKINVTVSATYESIKNIYYLCKLIMKAPYKSEMSNF